MNGETICTNIYIGYYYRKWSKIFGCWRLDGSRAHVVRLARYTCISDFMSIVKASSSKWINEQRFVKGKFQWQSGYGAFSYSRGQRDNVINYIMTQEEHHRIKTFKEEYIKMLTEFELEYDNKYLFEFYD